MVLCGISTCFQVLSPCLGQIVHALLTRPPLEYQPKSISSLDLHVLSTPPAFVLSQDQTLMFNPYPQLRSSLSSSPKPPLSPPRQGVLLIRNLTVSFLSSIFVSVSFSSFAVVVSLGFVALARGDRCYYSRVSKLCQHLFSTFYFFHLRVTIRTKSHLRGI